MARKIMIIFEDLENEMKGNFAVYLDGDKQRIGEIPDNELSSVEFWAMKVFLAAKEAIDRVETPCPEKDKTKWH